VAFVHDKVEAAGLSPRSVAERYDLDLADMHRALAYCHEHPEEMGVKRVPTTEHAGVLFVPSHHLSPDRMYEIVAAVLRRYPTRDELRGVVRTEAWLDRVARSMYRSGYTDPAELQARRPSP
jgi:hypothetical protein